MRIQPYGAVIALATALSFCLMAFAGRIRKSTLSVYAIFAVPLGFLFSRFFRALVSQGGYLFRENFLFNFSRGGYMLYGALVGCVLAAWLSSRITGEKCLRILDAAAAPGMFLVCCARLAESLTGSGYGRDIAEWFDPWMEESMIALENPEFFFRFPFGVLGRYGEWNWCVFFPEALAALIIMILLRTRKPSREGGLFCQMLLLYAGTQILFESIRQDAIPRWGFVRVNQLFSAISILAVLAVSCRLSGKTLSTGRKSTVWAMTAFLIGLVIAMEFALEKKIPFLRWMRMDLCYLVMSLACLGLILTVNSVRKAAFPTSSLN